MRTGCRGSRGWVPWSVSRRLGGLAAGYRVPWARLAGAKGQRLEFVAASGGTAAVVARIRASFLNSGIML